MISIAYDEDAPSGALNRPAKTRYVEIAVVGLFCLLGFLYYYGQSWTAPSSWTAVTVIVAIFWFYKSAYWQWENNSPKWVMGDYFSTIDGRSWEAGEYLIVPLGGIDTNYWKWPGKKGTAIFPKEALNMFGNSMAIHCQARPMNIEEMPSHIRAKIREHGCPEPYLVGWAGGEAYVEYPELEFLISENKTAHLQVFLLEEAIRDKHTAVEKVVGFGRRVSKSADPTTIRKLGEKLRPREEV